jgi:hypothetical protein
MVTNLVIVSTRGGSDLQKVRSLRESVAQIRVQLEAAETRVRKQHTVQDDGKEPSAGSS